ncbi:cytochrome P450 [Bradyrhizobium manausense]|uniref:bifunctional cytochrome P450/NADPH--P450 reductase n=1 Tax=Bradyrhizobium manausense TaxID=989370 RepID=UPI001BA76554|nr:cytochrome P450 [Bradyrhizobium manausense]MBR0834811.1 cytochrome P450 [Bradyrhizobium manausense]
MVTSNDIPQPRPLPIIGNLADIDRVAPIQNLMRLAKEYGPIFRLQVGGRTTTILGSQELVNEVCDEERFSKKLSRSVQRIRDFAGDGLFTAYNDEPNWAKAHRLLMPAFGPLGIRSMFERMEDIADQMLLRWERHGPDAVIDVADNMTRLTLDTIALCAFDYRFNSFYQNEMHPFVSAMVGALAESGARANRPDVVSNILVGTKRRYEADIALMRGVADTLIAERRKNPDKVSRHDLLSLMIDGRDPETGEGLSDENIRNQMITFLIAGHETTSGLLSFAVYFLMRNPVALATARQQVDEVLGGERPRVEHLPKLRYVEHVLFESLRLWPTAPAFAVAPRAPTSLAGRYPTQPGDTFLVLAPVLHRDPKVWEEPEAFRPERFAPDRIAMLPPNAWKPFGNGARACIGRAFALQEAQLVLSMILQRFDLIDADPGYGLQIAETLTLKPHDFRIRVRRRGEMATRPGGVISAVPQKVELPASSPVSKSGTPLLVLYGSNSGSSEAFARRISADAATQGYAASVAPMNSHVGQLPTEGAVVIVTASYEGQPPDNAGRFLAWIEGLGADTLTGVRYAVFGCGNRQWTRTWQAVPKRVDSALEQAGAIRVKPRGETDAEGDFLGGFEEWYAGLWSSLAESLGKRAVDHIVENLDVEIVGSARLEALRLAELGLGRVLENRELVDISFPSARSKRHIEFVLPDGANYRAGDYLAVLPRNAPADVERALRRFGLSADTHVVIRKTPSMTALPTGYPIAILDIFTNYVELNQPATRIQVGQLVEATRCPPAQEALRALASPGSYETEVLGKRLSLLDLLERFPASELGLGAFLTALPPLRARQYSISSSPMRDPKRCSLTVAVLDVPALCGTRRHRGVASNYLAGLSEGTSVSVAVRPSLAPFHPPDEPATPMIMVCAGSGIAPFHGFLQERALQKAAGANVGPALLFFGVDRADVDYLYCDELHQWQRDGVVGLRPAFSQAPEAGVRFVQDRVWQDRAEVADLFRRGAKVFVCGDGAHMAPAVRETFVRIYQEAVGVSLQEAHAWAETIEREQSRYVADVFA